LRRGAGGGTLRSRNGGGGVTGAGERAPSRIGELSGEVGGVCNGDASPSLPPCRGDRSNSSGNRRSKLQRRASRPGLSTPGHSSGVERRRSGVLLGSTPAPAAGAMDAPRCDADGDRPLWSMSSPAKNELAGIPPLVTANADRVLSEGKNGMGLSVVVSASHPTFG